MPTKSHRKTIRKNAPKLPPPTDWRTTDADELAKRKLRAREERFRIENLDFRHPVYSNFLVHSQSGMTYHSEIRDVLTRQYSCTCTDFRINGLGTCKHIEAVLLHLSRRARAEFKAAQRTASPRVDIVPDATSGRLRIERNFQRLPDSLRESFDADGLLRPEIDPAAFFAAFQRRRVKIPRLSQDVRPWLESAEREEDRIRARRDYEFGVLDGRHPEHVTLSPLFPYQREGMLHLAFKERALLADEMGLGKTIQAIAACALLHHLGKARRALVVTPASLKAEWEEQIQRFTRLPLRLIFGGRAIRTALYNEPDPPFFSIANYEQIVADSLDINARLAPDIVVLDEAQRIKNWSTKTAQAVKRLKSRYAFVLTGTPIENRIDDLRSLVDFLDPTLLGPLFRFNREYYELDEKGRPLAYRNLDKLRERVRPILLRRRKAQVETELPDRADRTHFVSLTPAMRDEYEALAKQVAELVRKAEIRALTPREQEILMTLLNMMRMVCDSPGIMKNNPSKECPKREELARILEEILADADVKAIVFSEWTGMLEFMRDWAVRNGIRYAWHTGQVEQRRRRAEILTFRNEPDCRLFFSTDSGGVGLNLQNASVVINCDLPWNPAKLEQRIARAWRKGQRRPVTIINLVAENTIEHGMLETLANKAGLAEGVLDGGDLEGVRFRGGGQSLLKRLRQVMGKIPTDSKQPKPARPADPAAHFATTARAILGDRVTHCEESWIPGSDVPTIIAVVPSAHAPELRPQLERIHAAAGWPGTPPPLEILDDTTWQALQGLAKSGFLTIDARATRPLLPATHGG